MKTELFKEALNTQAYLKAGYLGFAGSGKTYTASLTAKGIYEMVKDKKPVYFMDTETGSDFLVPKFKEWGVPLFVSKSRAFTDLLAAVAEAEKNASVLIIDSISHFWTELIQAYMKANNRKRLLFQDWGPLKENWRKFTDAYLNSKVHIIMCGRAGYEYDYFTDESGAKTLEKTGTKMKAETEMGYEPSLLVEMVREKRESEEKTASNKKRVEGQLWDHTAYILKDRTSTIEGKTFRNPSFEDFKPVFNYLNLGGDHIGVDTDRNSTALFERDSPDNWQQKRKQVEILKEEIQGELTSAYPGRAADDTKIKTDLVYEAFGTRSWVALDEMTPDELRKGLEVIRAQIVVLKSKPPEDATTNGTHKEKSAKAGR